MCQSKFVSPPPTNPKQKMSYTTEADVTTLTSTSTSTTAPSTFDNNLTANELDTAINNLRTLITSEDSEQNDNNINNNNNNNNNTQISNPSLLAQAARKLTHLADDAELTALETPNRALRSHILRRVQVARVTAHEARQTAREKSLKNSRTSLFQYDNKQQQHDNNPFSKYVSNSQSQSQSQSNAQSIANDINETLRRTTAIVSDEVQRSRIAGDIFSDSTRTLKKTNSQHDSITTSIKQGGKTLRRLRNSERFANLLVIFSFAFFMCVAGYVASKRLKSSFLASVVVRPAANVISYPFSMVFRGRKAEKIKLKYNMDYSSNSKNNEKKPKQPDGDTKIPTQDDTAKSPKTQQKSIKDKAHTNTPTDTSATTTSIAEAPDDKRASNDNVNEKDEL